MKLIDFRGRMAVVLYFYPKDDTTGCTAEACKFRDEIGDFRAIDAQVLGVSSDSPESHSKFIAKYGLPFPLLSDKGGRVRKLYGVKSTFGIIPGRATFVIDRDGTLRHAYSSQSAPLSHIEEALLALQKI